MTESPIRLLVVDDEGDFLQAMAKALGRRGFAVSMAQDGETALMMLGRQCYDVAILDLAMPGVDGLTLFRRMREEYPDLPIIMLTGFGSIRGAFEASREGVFEYLTKPCGVEQVADVARRAHAARSTRGGAPQPRTRLLIVDEERELLESLSAALAQRGFEVTAARSSAEAAALFAERRFEVALVDARSAAVAGLSLPRWIRSMHPLTEVLVLTDHASARGPTEGLVDGCTHLMKPQSPDALADKIRRALREGQARQRAPSAQRTSEGNDG